MKRGSKSVRCEMCGAIVGWLVPTDKWVFGMNVKEMRRKDNYREKGGMCVHIRCSDCADGDGWAFQIKNVKEAV